MTSKIKLTFCHVKANSILIVHMYDVKLMIENLQFQASSKSRLRIILCHLFSMPLVWITLISNVMKLEQEFIHKYRVGITIFDVLLSNNHIQTQNITS